ncbi:MAG: hypothetical protein H3C27_08505 [Opitutaceae bacterium]|nr:hypothetical protein [Opitutaceae bacterium]
MVIISNMPDDAQDFTQQVNVKMSVELKLKLSKFHRRHKIAPTDLLRGLAEAAVDFSEKHGHFSFPLAIIPAHNVSKAMNPQYVEARNKGITTTNGQAAPDTTQKPKIRTQRKTTFSKRSKAA